MRTAVMSCFVLALLWGTDGWAQTQQRDPGIPSNYTPANTWRIREFYTSFWRLAKISKDYQLGPGDELEIGVYGVADLSAALQSTKVASSGEISLPLVGTLMAAGLSAEELEQRIAAAYEEKGLLEKPEVLVTVVEYQAKPIYVVGEVDYPGQYIMSQPWTLTEAVLIAGGLDLSAGSYGYLHRRASEWTPIAPPPPDMTKPEVALPGYTVTPIDLRPLKEGGTFKPDLEMKVGDVFVVPFRKTATVFVLGDTMRQGAIVLPPKGTAPVSRVLSAAGGPKRTAKLSEGIIVRYDAAGKRQELKVDYKAILEGRRPDVEAQDNDVIFVPGSSVKNVGYAMLTAVPMIMERAAFIAIIP